jgi:DNA-binding protein HU-beta
MTNMNNADIAEVVATSADISKADAKKVVDAVFAAIGEAAAKGDEVSLAGFGKFKVKDQPERQGRNPATGEAITIAASKKLGFTPAKAIKDRLNG